jgi:hypothetical protein
MTGDGHLQKFLPKILHSEPLRKSRVGLKPWPTEVRTEGLKVAMLVRVVRRPIRSTISRVKL